MDEDAGVVEFCVNLFEPSSALIDPIVAVSFFVETVDGMAIGRHNNNVIGDSEISTYIENTVALQMSNYRNPYCLDAITRFSIILRTTIANYQGFFSDMHTYEYYIIYTCCNNCYGMGST